MNMPTLPIPETALAARLLIQIASNDRADDRGVEYLIQRLRARGPNPAGNALPVLGLEIHDLRGHNVLSLEATSLRLDVTLPAGTYVITTQVGGVCRGYTVTLEQGAEFDLHLPQARHRH